MIRQIYVVFLLVWIAGCQSSDTSLFSRLSSSSTGITFKNTLKESPEFNVMKYSYFYNGGGVATGDVDKDGRCDIFFTGNLVASHLYLNLGNWKFKNIAKEAGIEAAGLWNTGVTMADVNQDGWLDIYICRSAAKDPNGRRNLLFINQGTDKNGQVTFSEESAQYGVDDPAYSTHASFFDYDRDGDLDLFVLNHSLPEYSNFNNRIGQLKKRENPNYGDKLYRNDDNRYVDVTEEAGIIKNVLGFGLGLAISDFDHDGWPDIYVSNDFNEEDYLYMNGQDGTFRECLNEWMDHTSLFSMGSDAADVNNDGSVDLITLDMLPEDNYRIKLTSGSDNFNKYQLLLQQGFYRQSMRNMLQLNEASGQFREIGQMSGISNSDWSWSALIADYDLDGWQDLFVTNGYLRDYTNMDFMSFAVDMTLDNKDLTSDENIEELLKHMPEINEPNKIYKNQNGFVFSDSSQQWGFTQKSLSNGAAYADLDNDGDLDLVVNNVNDFAGVYRNTASERKMGHFLKIKPDRGDQGTVVGTSITIYSDSLQMRRDLYPSRGFQSSVEPLIYFGLGQMDKVDSLIVQWPDGKRELFDYVQLNSLLILKQGTGSPAREKKLETARTVFTEDTLVAYQHQEDEFNDFARQSLLPKYYSRMGPPVVSADLDNDQITDLIVGGAAGQAAGVYLGNSNGTFSRLDIASLELDSRHEDVAILPIDVNKDSYLDLIIASGGNLAPSGNDLYHLRCYVNQGNGDFRIAEDFPKLSRNASCLVNIDFDNDGDQDIFLGSLYEAQNYPRPGGNSMLVNNGSGSFETVQNLPFADYRASAGAAADVDADGQMELVLAGEWEYIEVWSFSAGEWTLEAKSNHRGWYSSLHIADLDTDPNLEIVYGNWGLNSQIQATSEKPLILYSGDFDQNGRIDPVLSYFVGDNSYPFVSRDDLIGQIPSLKKLFTSYRDYAEYTMEDLLPSLPNPASDTIHHLETGLLDLVDGSLSEHPLPLEAQAAPVYAIETLDFDRDGDLDLILAGNSNYNRVKIGEIDANHGLLLENTGNLTYQTITAKNTGLHLSGEVRSITKIKVNNQMFLLFGISDDVVRSVRLQALDPI